jgi:hypothetical protein
VQIHVSYAVHDESPQEVDKILDVQKIQSHAGLHRRKLIPEEGRVIAL